MHGNFLYFVTHIKSYSSTTSRKLRLVVDEYDNGKFSFERFKAYTCFKRFHIIICYPESTNPNLNSDRSQTSLLVKIQTGEKLNDWKNDSFMPPLCAYRLSWARRASWGWWDELDDTVLKKTGFEITLRHGGSPRYWIFTSERGRNLNARAGDEPAISDLPSFNHCTKTPGKNCGHPVGSMLSIEAASCIVVKCIEKCTMEPGHSCCCQNSACCQVDSLYPRRSDVCPPLLSVWNKGNII